MKIVYAVLGDSGEFASHPEVDSVWSTQRKADKRREQLTKIRCYTHWAVEALDVNPKIAEGK